MKAAFYFVLLIQLIACSHGYYIRYYDDSLANSSLKLVPTTLGSDVDLRCFKALKEDVRPSYTPSAICDPDNDPENSGCGHMWSKGNTTLGMVGNDTSKYEFAAHTSYGYCATFDDTTQRFNSLNFKFNETAQSGRFRCLVSVLSIKNVTLDDLGVYTCNFSTHNERIRYGKSPELDSVEVALSGSKAQPKEIIYAQLAYQSKDSDMVIQCVSTGGNIKWMLFPYKGGYDCGGNEYRNYIDYCSKYTILLENFNTTDHWMSYNYSVVASTPYDDVHESFLAVRGATLLDKDKIACIVEGTTEGKVMEITDHRSTGYGYGYYYTDAELIAIICTTIFCVLLFIPFIIVASVRSGCASGSTGAAGDQQFVTLAVPIGSQQPSV